MQTATWRIPVALLSAWFLIALGITPAMAQRKMNKADIEKLVGGYVQAGDFLGRVASTDRLIVRALAEQAGMQVFTLSPAGRFHPTWER